MKRWMVQSLDHWKPIATEIAKQLHDGDILTLRGPLGAGKTTFVQYLVHALGGTRSPKSPTFALMRSYAIKNGRRLLHIDAYRIESEQDLLPLALDEELDEADTIIAIEWPEKIPHWLAMHPHKKIEIIHDPNSDTRAVLFTP